MTGGPEPISAVAREAFERELAQLRTDRAAVAATLRGGKEVGDQADQADELQRASNSTAWTGGSPGSKAGCARPPSPNRPAPTRSAWAAR